MKRVFLIGLSLFAILAACQSRKPSADSDSGLSAVNVRLPDRSAFPKEVAGQIDSYKLQISPSGCSNGKSTQKVEIYTASLISGSLSKGCDYNVSLDVGRGAGSSLATTYFSGSNSIKASEFQNKDKVSMIIKLNPTTASQQQGVNVNQNINTLPAGESDLELCVEVAGKVSNCQTPIAQSTQGVTGPVPVASSSGDNKCFKEDALWKSQDGGCKNLRSNIVFSRVSNFNGAQFQRLKDQAEQYCSGLAPANAWRLITIDDVKAVAGTGMNDHLAGSYIGYFWVLDPADQTPNNRIKIALESGHMTTEQSGTHYVICAKK